MTLSPYFVMLNLFQHNKRRCVVLKQVQDDDRLELAL